MGQNDFGQNNGVRSQNDGRQNDVGEEKAE